ncbi:MAG TPA: sigma-70 family RNA polymerase sigma factor [Vicinamibacterales bacterium]|nr:sigma-70 family RNA polymerase sigma factor [Vicinamibacterales bacterium]
MTPEPRNRGTPEARNHTDDEALFLEFLAGDRPAFDELFARYRQPVWAFFRRRVPDAAEAEELAQETFLALLNASRRYEARASFRSYLFGIAFNLLSAARRKTQRRGEVSSPEGHDVAAPATDPAAVLWVRQALAALDPKDREIVMLREFEALEYAEIANVLAVPVNTVRSRLFRARLALRHQLAGVQR